MNRIRQLSFALLLPGLLLTPTWGQDALFSGEVVSGVIEDIDRTELKVTIKTDIGRDMAFPVKNPELLTDLRKGERVIAHLDQRHIATKITKAAIPELTVPPN